MKKKIIKNGHVWPEQAIKDMQRVGEDVEAIIEGESEPVVMNVLINLFLQPWIVQGKPKDKVMKILSDAYDVIEKQRQAENESKRA